MKTAKVIKDMIAVLERQEDKYDARVNALENIAQDYINEGKGQIGDSLYELSKQIHLDTVIKYENYRKALEWVVNERLEVI